MSARAAEGTPAAGPPFAVVDLDGTVADVRHRLHHIAARPKDWSAFFAAAPSDTLLDEGFAVVERLRKDHEMVWLTGRPERCRADTVRWLARHDLPPGRLLMRPDGDRRPARTLKLGRVRALVRERPVAVVVDDDLAVVTALRAVGIAVLHADWGHDSAAGSPVASPTAVVLSRAQEGDGRT